MQTLWLILSVCGVFLLLTAVQAVLKAERPVRSAVGGVLTGFLVLAAVNLTGLFTGVSLPVTPLTLGVSGVAGIPGVTLLLLLNLLFR